MQRGAEASEEHACRLSITVVICHHVFFICLSQSQGPTSDLLWRGGGLFWDSNGPATASLSVLTNLFKKVFSPTSSSISIHDELFHIHQGKTSVSDYALRFHTLAATSGWNKTALLTAYRRGLNTEPRRHMAIYDNMTGLESFILKLIRISQQLHACTLDEPAVQFPLATTSVAPAAPEPMQVHSYCLSCAERQWHIQNHLCLYFGSDGHLISQCSICPPCPAVSTIQLPPMIAALTHTTVSLTTSKHSVGPLRTSSWDARGWTNSLLLWTGILEK